MRLSPARLLTTGAALLVAGCSMVVPADFDFIRDDANLLADAAEAQAEEQLRAIAQRSGIYGVVLTADEFPDDEAAISPIVDQILARGGEALVALCSPARCDLSQAIGVSGSLSEAASQVAPAPEPAPGQGIPNPPADLADWVSYVGAVSTLER